MTSQAEKIEAAYEKISEGVKELVEAEYEGNFIDLNIDIDVAAGNIGLYAEDEYRNTILDKAAQQKQQQEKEQMYKELSALVDIIYNAKNEEEAIEKLEKYGVKGYRM